MRKATAFPLLLVVAAFASRATAQTTISTDGVVEAHGFIGDGHQVTGVDADLLDSMDSSTFAQDSDLQEVEARLQALEGQVNSECVAKVPRTGQTEVELPGDDGDLQLGVVWPNPRFTDNGDGTVTDNLTGLIWLRDANCLPLTKWVEALDAASSVFDGCTNCGGTDNDCGLSDGSVPGEWRLPNVRELHSLVHYGVWSPAVPDTCGTGQWSEGNPFSGVQLGSYWSSTKSVPHESFGEQGAWLVNMERGRVFPDTNIFGGPTYHVWAVRGGQ